MNMCVSCVRGSSAWIFSADARLKYVARTPARFFRNEILSFTLRLNIDSRHFVNLLQFHISFVLRIVKYFNERTLIVLNDKYFNNFGPVPVTRFDPSIHQVLYIGHQSIFSFDTLVIKRVEKYLIKNKSTKRRKILYPRHGTTLLVKSISPTFSGTRTTNSSQREQTSSKWKILSFG